MTNFRLDVSRETGLVTLWMATKQTPCGFKPVIGWHDIDGVKEFAEMLLNIYHYRKRERDRLEQVSENIIEQAIGNNIDFLKEDSGE